MSPVIERFAPSPTGGLHLGHALSALLVWEAAKSAGGRFLLRMEDLDAGRCRPHFAEQVKDELLWLGTPWDGPVLHQSTRREAYDGAIAELDRLGLVYPCHCTRAEIQAAVGAPQEGAEQGSPYPGTCRGLPPRPSDQPQALRLDLRKAVGHLGGPDAVRALRIVEIGSGPNGETGEYGVDPDALIAQVGDIVLRRKDGSVAYHLAVTVDDAFQGVTHVTRGSDLFSSTPLHRVLQALTRQPTPIYRHHRLVRDASGRRLAKRDGDQSLTALREAGVTPAEIRARVSL